MSSYLGVLPNVSAVLPQCPTKGECCPTSVSYQRSVLSYLSVLTTGQCPTSVSYQRSVLSYLSVLPKVSVVLSQCRTNGECCPISVSHQWRVLSYLSILPKASVVLPHCLTKGECCPTSLSYQRCMLSYFSVLSVVMLESIMSNLLYSLMSVCGAQAVTFSVWDGI